MTTVNIRTAPKGWQDNSQYVYIGRYNKRYGVQRSIWHNPFRMSDYKHLPLNNDEIRANVINKYTAHLEYNTHLLARLPELDNKILVCWCSPQACHGDVLCNWYTMLSKLALKGKRYKHTSQATPQNVVVAQQTLDRYNALQVESRPLTFDLGAYFDTERTSDDEAQQMLQAYKDRT